MTYGALAARTDAFARGLLARGLAAGDRVAILAANSTDYLVACFGAMRAGLIAVPVGFKFPTATIHCILADCGAKLVVTDAERLTECPDGIERAVIGGGGPDRFEALLDPGPFDCVPTGSEDIGMILYTSGSTGRPKGVPLSHAGQIWVLNNMDPDGSALGQERFLVAAPLYHMNGLPALQARRGDPRVRSAAAPVSRRRLHRSDRALWLHLRDFGTHHAGSGGKRARTVGGLPTSPRCASS